MSIARAMARSRIRRRVFQNAASANRGSGSSYALVLQFRDTAAAKLSSFAILERVQRDQFEIVDDECGDRDAKRAAIRDPKDVPCDTVGNPADPDASYNAHKGQGYMAQIVETYCEDDSNEAVAATPDLITHVEVHKMTVHDGHRLADALDDLSERALTPAVMLGDSHYGSSDNMALTREQNINLVAPARPPKGAVSGRLTLEDFTLNEEGLVLRCPNNVEPLSASLAKAKLQARFDLSICQKCADILRFSRAGGQVVTANFLALSILPRPGLPTKSAGCLMNFAMASATSTDGLGPT